VILHCIVEDKWTLCRPQRLISEAHGVDSVAFLQCHDLQRLLRHTSNLKHNKKIGVITTYKVTVVRNGQQVLTEAGIKASSSSTIMNFKNFINVMCIVKQQIVTTLCLRFF
jgi:hypothetical protein